MKFDDVLVSVGEFGWYQRRVYLLLCLPAVLSGAQVLSAVFIMAIPDYRCKIPGYPNDTYDIQSSLHADLVNMSIPRVSRAVGQSPGLSQCLLYTQPDPRGHDLNVTPASIVAGGVGEGQRSAYQCKQWVYDRSEFDSTAITEFDVVCGDTILRSICNSIMFAGALVGSIVMGIIADIFGRKRAIMLSLLIQFVTSLCVYLTPSFAFMIALKSVSGIGTHSLFAVGATMGIELVGPGKRTFTGMMVEFFWAGGVLLALPIAFLCRDWRYTQLVICLLTVPLFSLWWLIPESPRWLISERRYAEAEQVLERICRANKTKLPQGALDADTTNEGPRDKLVTLCSHRVLLCRTLIVFFNWLSVNLMYYGLSLNTDNMGGSTYLNYLLGVGLEIVAYLLCFLLLDKTGRRRFHCFCMLVGGAVCLATLLPMALGGEEHQWMVTALAHLGRMCASGAYAILYIMSAELFPTVVRNSAIGVCCIFESLGGMVSPYIADLGLIVGGPGSMALPMVVFGSVSVLAGLLSLTLPETLHKTLPETIQDAVDFDKPRKSPSPSNCFISPMLDCNSRTPLSSSQV